MDGVFFFLLFLDGDEGTVDQSKATDDLHIDDMIRIFIYTQIRTTKSLLHSSFSMMVV